MGSHRVERTLGWEYGMTRYPVLLDAWLRETFPAGRWCHING
jgi:hypothetical protein